MSFEDQFENDKKEQGIRGKSDYFKIQEKDNKMRVLAEPKIIVQKFLKGENKSVTYYENCGYDEKYPKASKSYKYLTWIIDRSDGKMKLFKMPYKAAQQLVALKRDGEYTFAEFPMPYDINIKAENAGTTKVTYTVIPAKKETPLTAEEEDELGKATIVESIIARIKQKQMEADGVVPTTPSADESVEYPEEEVNPEDIPF